METTTAVAESSTVGRMFNLLAAPGEVYAEIKEKPVNHANWLVPALVSTFCGIFAVLLLFSQDWAMREVMVAQQKAMDKNFAEQIRKGKMTQDQADQVKKQMDKMAHLMPLFVKIGGSMATVAYAFAGPFFWGFLIWLAGVQFFKADFEYLKAVEAAGLATIIYTLAAVVGVLLSFALGRLAYLSPAFFLKDIDLTNKLHQAMAATNPFYLWFAAVIATALANLSGVSWAKAAAVILGFWVAVRLILIGINMGQFTM